MQVQVRWGNGRIEMLSSVREAFDLAKVDRHIEKISWIENGKNIRFVRDRTEAGDPWYFEPMDEVIKDALKDTKLPFTW